MDYHPTQRRGGWGEWKYSQSLNATETGISFGGMEHLPDTDFTFTDTELPIQYLLNTSRNSPKDHKTCKMVCIIKYGVIWKSPHFVVVVVVLLTVHLKYNCIHISVKCNKYREKYKARSFDLKLHSMQFQLLNYG